MANDTETIARIISTEIWGKDATDLYFDKKSDIRYAQAMRAAKKVDEHYNQNVLIQCEHGMTFTEILEDFQDRGSLISAGLVEEPESYDNV